jgi:5'-nucleotidase/UDP-sugar diphosphatase
MVPGISVRNFRNIKHPLVKGWTMKKYLDPRTLLGGVLFLVLSGCAAFQDIGWQQDHTYKITILHTNDHHGRFWQNKYGEYGMAARKTLIDELRAEIETEGGRVLLLSGGDINTGVPESDLQDAEPDFQGMNRIGYDAMAVGNHEFDNPLEVLFKQEKWAKFPMLSANIYDKATGERLFQPYTMFEQQGLKIAVIGLTTEDTATIGNPEYISTIEFRDPKEEAKHLIADLREVEQPDMIFAVTHMGHYENGNRGINAPGDVALARFLDEGDLDMIVGGHSQEPVCMEAPDVNDSSYKPGDVCRPDKQNGTWIVQAYEWGKYVGRADFEFRNGSLKLSNYELIPVNLKRKVKKDGKTSRVFATREILQDHELLAFLKPYQEKGQDRLLEQISVTNGRLEGDRQVVRFQQTNLGRLIATAQMQRTKADFAIVNSGGIRDSLEEGVVTYKDILIVQPYGNSLTYTDMSGAEIQIYLDAVAVKPVDSGAFAQFAGISLTVENGTVRDVVIEGQPLDPARTYRVAVPSYNAAGGDGYPKLTDHPGYVNTGFVDAEVLKAFMEANSPLDVKVFQPGNEIVYR